MVSTNPTPEIKHPSRRAANPYQHFYDRQLWRGPRGLRAFVLRRDPVCVLCNRNATTIADHIKDHKGNWELFIDVHNLQGICKTCHDAKTSRESGGFGNPLFVGKPADNSAPAATGSAGKQFQSSSVSTKKLDAALDFDVDSLLEGIPK